MIRSKWEKTKEENESEFRGDDTRLGVSARAEKGAAAKMNVEVLLREYALKKFKRDAEPVPWHNRLLNRRFLILGACALFLAVVGVCIMPPILSSGISRYKPNLVRQAKLSLDNLARALGRYRFDVGAYPTTEEGLEVLVCIQSGDSAKIRQVHPGWKGPYIKRIPNDPWGQRFVYVAGKEGDLPTLYSCGSDCKAGTPDDLLPHQALFSEQSWDTSWTRFRRPLESFGWSQQKACKTATKDVANDVVKPDLALEEFDELNDASDIIVSLLVGVVTFAIVWPLLWLILSPISPRRWLKARIFSADRKS